MKKIMSWILMLTLLLPLAGVRVSASDVIGPLELSEIEEIDKEKIRSYSVNYNNRIIDDSIGDDDLDYLLEKFSNENLICINSEIGFETDAIGQNTYKRPKDGSFTIRMVDEETWKNYQYHFAFDKDKVYVVSPQIIDISDKRYYNGWFEFKDENTYDELIAFFEELYAEDVAIDEKRESDSQKNKIAISDFKILYNGTMQLVFSDPFQWGVCSYIREGETEPVYVYYFGLINDPDYKLFAISETMEENNTVVLDNKERMLTIKDGGSVGVEYDTNMDLSYAFKIQVNVADDMTADGITTFYKHFDETTTVTKKIDMSEYTQTGKLPAELFSAENNINYSGEENKVKDFTKIYTETFTTNNSLLKNGEWGICKYNTEASGDVTAIYLYIADEDVYLIRGKKQLSADFTNIISFSTQAIVDENEIFNYDKYRIQLNIGVNTGREVYYRLISHINHTYHDINMNFLNKVGEFEGVDIVSNKVQETTEQTKETETKTEDNKTEEKQQTETKTEEKTENDKVTAEKTEEKEESEKTEEKQETEKEEEKAQTTEQTEKNADKAETEETVISEPDFIDVPKSHWAYYEIDEFSERGIVLGYGNGYFGVNDSITYEHFGLLLERMFQYNAENTESKPAIREDVIVSVVKALNWDVANADESIIEKTFTDCDGIKAENRKYIAAAIEKGLVEGYAGKLFADSNLTRAETVTLLARAERF